MQLTQLYLKNFRCFSEITLAIDHPLLLIEGLNGSGKTSLLEALHYVCYLRSFRTHSPRELLQFGHDTFFIKIKFIGDPAYTASDNELQVGFSGKKRLVKLNQKAIQSYKELTDHYRVVTLTENDLDLIKGGPDVRRSFIDQAIALYEPNFFATLKRYKKVVEQRNALLQHGSVGQESYQLWTKQLWEQTCAIQQARVSALKRLEEATNALISEYFEGRYSLGFSYKPKKVDLSEPSFEEFYENNGQKLLSDELRFCRSLFGAHLDDIAFLFQDKKSKNYASRGQQKLIVLLIKIAQIDHLRAKKGPIIFLLDDFMTDFDEEKAGVLLKIMLSMNIQLMFTSPLREGVFEQKLLSMGAQKVKLTI